MGHNHFTRDIKAPGKCPGCDEYHDRRLGESGVLGCCIHGNAIHYRYPCDACDVRRFTSAAVTEVVLSHNMVSMDTPIVRQQMVGEVMGILHQRISGDERVDRAFHGQLPDGKTVMAMIDNELVRRT